jgi:O-antigen ligase
MESMMNGTQSGKTFVFLFILIILSIVLLLQSLFFSRTKHFQINIMDGFLLIWCLYVFLNNYLQKVPFSLHLFEFYGLIILYIAVRLTQRKYLMWLYVALISGGIIQTVYGSLQFFGILPSHHELFKITGSFFNPGPYAGYLASAFPVILGLCLFNPSIRLPAETKSLSRLTNLITLKSLAVVLIFCMCLVLLATHSRAALIAVLISAFYLFSIKFKPYEHIRTYFGSLIKRILLFITLLILLVLSLTGLYHLNKESVDGRFLIWKVSMNMIRDKPVSGYGFDQFKAHYMNYQASYFEQNQASEEAMVAGDSNYAFNELLQVSVENGVPGLVMIALMLIIIFMSSGFSNYGTVYKIQKEDITGIVAKAGIISILVFGLFSYPSEILPIKTNMVLYLATVAGLCSKMKMSLPVTSTRRNRHLLYNLFRIIFSVILILLIYSGSKSLYRCSKAYHLWNKAYQLYQIGAYQACLENYEKAWPALNSDGDFLTGYGKSLSMSGKYDKAVEVLLQAAGYYPNVVVYTALGDSYKQLGETGLAEQAYLHAWYMNPGRFYTKYLLAKLYYDTGQEEKAIQTANELLLMQVKVPSTAIDEILEEMQNIIIHYKDRNYKK